MQDHYVDLGRRIANLIRFGTIAEVDTAGARVRVTTGGILTQWIPWMAARAGSTAEWNPPTVGEQVLLLSPSGEPAAGVALVGLYTEARPAPSSSPDEHVTAYPDGAVIKYNHAASVLEVTGIKTASVEASESADVTGVKNASVEASQSTTVTSPYVNIIAPASVGVVTPSVTISGNLTVAGAIAINGGERQDDLTFDIGAKNFDVQADSAKIDSPDTKMTGDVEIQGNLHVIGNFTVDGTYPS